MYILFLGCFFLWPVVKDKTSGAVGICKWNRTLISCENNVWKDNGESHLMGEELPLPMWLFECQNFMSRLTKCPPLSLARTNVSFECLILSVKNCFYELWEQIRSAGATACKSPSSFPCSLLISEYSWRTQQPTTDHTSWGEETVGSSNITAENTDPKASVTWFGQKLLKQFPPLWSCLDLIKISSAVSRKDLSSWAPLKDISATGEKQS